MIHKFMWFTFFFLILMFSFELEIYFLLCMLFLIFLISGLILMISDENSWISMMILIFLIGGLMVSFFYMVSLSHNSMFNFKMSLMPMIFLFSFFNMQSFQILKYSCLSDYWLMKNSYTIFVILVLYYMIIVLIFVDQKLSFIKGCLKEFG
uniref:NADH dehydrogenase subunit 6 n=1 Tax=Liposcelis sculptilimacula TaxID=1899352 RepID=A0A191ZS51_9NEOP|nr:NADH dehydrogenase subunit 6 [Liposcelis keleri]ANJ70945.1 NADH dehydrogenase subunit 6 [Liposcelis sculptilimacula]